jgi:hypothetical protein
MQCIAIKNIGEVQGMEQILPLEEAKIRGYIGKPVYAVLGDGSYFSGYLSEIKDGHIILSSGTTGQGTVSTNASRAKAQLASKKKPVRTSAYGSYGGHYPYPYPYPGYTIALPLFLLALLFAVPFGFWF